MRTAPQRMGGHAGGPPTRRARQTRTVRHHLVARAIACGASLVDFLYQIVRGTSLNLSTLKSDKFILREKGSGTRMAVDRHFKKNRFTPTVRMALGSNEAIKEAVAGGLGVSVISSHALGAKPQSQGLAVLNVRGFPLHSQWHLVCPKAKRLSPLALAFQAHLMQDASA